MTFYVKINLVPYAWRSEFMSNNRRPQHVYQEPHPIWGFDRIIRFMSEKAGGFGLIGPRNIW